jgi:hypothetical protein
MQNQSEESKKPGDIHSTELTSPLKQAENDDIDMVDTSTKILQL